MPIRAVVWPEGVMDVIRLRDVREGHVLAPADWEGDYIHGRTDVLPWAGVLRRPITLKMGAPGRTGPLLLETKIPCKLPTGELMYFSGRPVDFVRVIAPPSLGRSAPSCLH